MKENLDKSKEIKKKKTRITSQKFKNSYFDFYDDIKTNPRQDW